MLAPRERATAPPRTRETRKDQEEKRKKQAKDYLWVGGGDAWAEHVSATEDFAALT